MTTKFPRKGDRTKCRPHSAKVAVLAVERPNLPPCSPGLWGGPQARPTDARLPRVLAFGTIGRCGGLI